MSRVKADMFPEFVRVRSLDGHDVECEVCHGGEAGYIRKGFTAKIVCASCVESENGLCLHCEDDIANGDEMPNRDWVPVPTCKACEAAFAR